MGSRKPLTEDQEEFIRNNRFNMSINAMCVEIGIGYAKGYKFMVKNNLILTEEENRKRKLNKIKPENKSNEWVSEPWEYGLNLITMRK